LVRFGIRCDMHCCGNPAAALSRATLIRKKQTPNAQRRTLNVQYPIRRLRNPCIQPSKPHASPPPCIYQ
jgi:hypothetical protein